MSDDTNQTNTVNRHEQGDGQALSEALRILRQDKRVVDSRMRDATETLRQLRKITDELERDIAGFRAMADDIDRRAAEVIAKMNQPQPQA